MTTEAMPKAHPLTLKLENWWREHASRPSDPAWQAYLKRFGELLLVKHEELMTPHVNERDGKPMFGMSGAGGCMRKASLKLLGAKPEPYSGSTLATFHLGHTCEIMALASLEAVGCKIAGAQTPVHWGPMSSFSDGICDGMVLSVKSASYKMSAIRKGTPVRMGFTAIVANGVKAENPGYWVQLQAEMAGLGIDRGLLVVIAKDMVKSMEADPAMRDNGSMTFYVEEVTADKTFAENLRGAWYTAYDSTTKGIACPAMIHVGGKFVLLPSPGDTASGWGGKNKEVTGNFNPCGGCDLAKACKELLKP